MLLLYPALAAVLLGAAVALRKRRDLGSGVVAARPGPERGSWRLGDAITLAIQVHGPALIVWTVAVGVLGVAFGMIAPGIGDLLDSGVAKDIVDRLGGLLVAAVLSMIAVVISYFAVAVVARAGSDEGAGRTELVLSTATSRSRWLAATLLVALLGASWLLLVTGVGLEIGYVGRLGPRHRRPGHRGAGLVARSVGRHRARDARFRAYGPAGPRSAGPGHCCSWWSPCWRSCSSCRAWVDDVSPYSHVPQLPAATWDWGAEGGLLAVAAALLGVAWWRFRERDIG